jgi:glutamine amidotransferase
VSVAIALIDYGAGNLASVRKALSAVGAEVVTPARPSDLARCAAVIVPGVGHFAATQGLDAPWRDAIRASVDAGRPLLGICLGLQWLFEGSDEAPGVGGLGLIDGRCFLLGGTPAGPTAPGRLKVPHVGWNALAIRGPSRLLEGIAPGAQAYFTHSYAAPVTAECVAVTDHGVPFASVVERGLVFGAQFHPEKSGEVGLRVVRNFVDLAAA